MHEFARATQWEEFKKQVTLPKNAQLVLLMVFVDGDGAALVDDLQIRKDDAVAPGAVFARHLRRPAGAGLCVPGFSKSICANPAVCG